MNALRLVDNKSNESDWDIDLLAEELPGLDLSAFDFDWGIETRMSTALIFPCRMGTNRKSVK